MTADLREVARRSGVSIATVSRALNGRPDVSAATRERVTEIARELGYLPNQQARALVRRRSDTVGLIWDTSYIATQGRQPFLTDLLVGLKMALANTGYHLLLISPQTADSGVDAFVRAAAQHSLDGVLLMAVNEHWPAVDALITSGRPCVGLDIMVRGTRATYVSADNRSGARLAARHLLQLGHTRIATITGPLEMLPGVDRLDGFVAGMADQDLDVPDRYIEHGDFFFESGYRGMTRLMALRDRPTAVFVAGDAMAVGALHAAQDAGLVVPDDISIVGYDDVEQAQVVRPTLTTIAQDYVRIGEVAVALLSSLMQEEDTLERESDGYPPPHLLPCKLIVRASTAPPPNDLRRPVGNR